MTTVNEKLDAVLEAHFDRKWGSPYWIERAENLPFIPLKDIQSIADLRLFGPMPIDELAARPIEHFIPRKYHGQLRAFVTSETGGSTGPPKRTAYLEREFEAAFVTPFIEAARLIGFPRDTHWLYIGPSGPHIIGKAARACAVAMGSIDPFMVDFDPRWARKLPKDSMARRRYVQHVVEQAERVLASQRIGVIFATPPVIEALGTRLTEDRRRNIIGIHLGGMAADQIFWRRLRSEWFTEAKILSGYGNSLAGVCPQIEDVPGKPPEYFAHGHRLVIEIEKEPGQERGQVVFHRLDESAFLPYVVERDIAGIAGSTAPARAAGFHDTGLSDPRPDSPPGTWTEGIY